MDFSESFNFGNSTFLKLESQVKRAIGDNVQPENYATDAGSNNQDIIQESPTYKQSSALSRTRLGNASNISKRSAFRKTKSDFNLGAIVQDNYSAFFSSNFTIEEEQVAIHEDKEVADVEVNKATDDLMRVSQIEAAFRMEEDVLIAADDDEMLAAQLSRSLAVDSFAEMYSDGSLLDAPIFSEDVREMQSEDLQPPEMQPNADSVDALWQNSLPLSDAEEEQVKEEVAAEELPAQLDECSFIVSNNHCKEAQHALALELERSKREVSQILQETQNMNYTMASGQLQVTPTSQTQQLLKRTQKQQRNEQHQSQPQQNTPAALPQNHEALKNIGAWHLPSSVLRAYAKKNINQMFDWQVECLSNPKVLFEHCNLVYSAPTSAGKTLVSEILLLKTILERQKKVLLILPFISVVREKMFYLQDLLIESGYRVEGFFGGYTPPGGFDSIHVAICTIEKANSIVNKLLEQHKLCELGIVVVDEVHLISDPGRGYILELLLAKIMYMSRKYELHIQIVTMSATLANVKLLQSWLQAELYISNFRPVALQEMLKVGSKIYDCQMKLLRDLTANAELCRLLPNDNEHVAQLCIETLLEGCSCIVFCPSKDWCEKLALQLAGAVHALGKSGTALGLQLRAQLKRTAIDEMKQQLQDIPTGLDTVLARTTTFGCAFHHAGLTTEERDIVESSFKSGALKIIVATSTLSSGVNLPARRVLIRSPLFGGKQMSSLTYRQMIGRAGRTGKDTLGESILVCNEANARIGRELIAADLKPISSCLEMESSTHLKRALLEVISSGVASSIADIEHFVNCTLLSAEKRMTDALNAEVDVVAEDAKDVAMDPENCLPDYIKESLDFLIEYEFIRMQHNEETHAESYVATRLGLACLASSMPPTDGLILFAELQKSRRCFVLESELHAVYLVTPYSVCYQMQDLDWLQYLDMWEKLTPAMKKVGELVGIKESFLVRAMRGQPNLDYKLMQIHKRFYTALALQELVNETPINTVALKYKCTRGMLQSLQQMASTFAGIVGAFCNSLQWSTLALVVAQFKERLFFGIQRELIDLMRLPDLNHKRARALYDAGITSLVELANMPAPSVEQVLFDALSFDSAKQHDNENAHDAARRNTERNFFITGKAGLTVGEAAKLLVHEARIFVQHEIGVGNINWTQLPVATAELSTEEGNATEQLHMSCEEPKGLKNAPLKRKSSEQLDKDASPVKLLKDGIGKGSSMHMDVAIVNLNDERKNVKSLTNNDGNLVKNLPADVKRNMLGDCVPSNSRNKQLPGKRNLQTNKEESVPSNNARNLQAYNDKRILPSVNESSLPSNKSPRKLSHETDTEKINLPSGSNRNQATDKNNPASDKRNLALNKQRNLPQENEKLQPLESINQRVQEKPTSLCNLRNPLLSKETNQKPTNNHNNPQHKRTQTDAAAPEHMQQVSVQQEKTNNSNNLNTKVAPKETVNYREPVTNNSHQYELRKSKEHDNKENHSNIDNCFKQPTESKRCITRKSLEKIAIATPPKTIEANQKSPTQKTTPRRNPRNHFASSTRIAHNNRTAQKSNFHLTTNAEIELFNDDDEEDASFEMNTGIENALKAADMLAPSSKPSTECLKAAETIRATPSRPPKVTETSSSKARATSSSVPLKPTSTIRAVDSLRTNASSKRTESPETTALLKSTESSRATGTSRPIETLRPTATSRTTVTTISTAISRPMESPTESLRPTATLGPTESSRPTATSRSAETSRPSATLRLVEPLRATTSSRPLKSMEFSKFTESPRTTASSKPTSRSTAPSTSKTYSGSTAPSSYTVSSKSTTPTIRPSTPPKSLACASPSTPLVCLNKSSDEIPSSQQLLADQDEHIIEGIKTPQSSRFLRSYRSQRLASPKLPKASLSVTNKKPPLQAEPAVQDPPSTSIELSDISLENSLMKNPQQLNASHILSCSKTAADAGNSFQSIDIIDICGNQALFKATFKELLAAQSFGMSLGLQKEPGKRRPIIGANLLLNQVTTKAQHEEDAKEYIFQLADDAASCSASYLVGIAFASANENLVYFMNMQDEGSCDGLTSQIKCKYLRMLLRSAAHTLLLHDAKEQLKVLRQLMPDVLEIDVALQDPKVANWLLQPDKHMSFSHLAQQFAPECVGLVALSGTGRGYSSLGLDAESTIYAKVRCCIEACVTGHILKGQIENLQRIGSGQLFKFFMELEMPLQLSLCNMETYGFPTCDSALRKLFQLMVESMKKLETRIYELHGSRFNLGSSAAVARILGLHRRGNGRVCTSRQILEKIDSPISQLIITYRKLSATLTKNIQPLLKCVVNDRIHGQSITFTSTGRISMTEPNLQNVAKDFHVELGADKVLVSCRSAFYAIDDKRCLISSDFCQLEMRILAHLSQDATLLQVMNSEADLFTAIAARWNKISEDKVSEQLRNGTKQICYGIVYGMGMRSLGEALKCTEQEALSVSEQFHAAYPGIRAYSNKVIKFAAHNGYIETITGRRRYLEQINSSEPHIKNQAERQAVNSTIQGSAADIAKSAILRMEKNILKYREKLGIVPHSVQLVLHLHDELIFEVPEEKAKKIAKVLSVTMENCVKLNVPLKVKLKIGKSWGSLQEVKL